MATAAIKEKEKGNAAYKGKRFDEAIQCYDAAISLDPSDITFYNNKGAVHYEKGEYDKVIEVCLKASEVGKENNAEYKHIGKSYARVAKAYFKKGNLDEAMRFYDKAITEHRSPDILNERSQVQKEIKEREAKAYINPEISKEERSKGNEFFKKGKFAEAIPFYTEAIKRNPEDHIPYSNRAACYTKLMEFGLAMQDCDKCIELNPGFIKGYLRKGAVLKMDKPQEAIAVYKKALEIDPSNHEANEGIRACRNTLNQLPPEERAKRAMSDPEIQSILQDPAMQVILEQMNKDPAAANEHLKNPVIMQKFSKLVESGIVKIA